MQEKSLFEGYAATMAIAVASMGGAYAVGEHWFLPPLILGNFLLAGLMMSWYGLKEKLLEESSHIALALSGTGVILMFLAMITGDVECTKNILAPVIEEHPTYSCYWQTTRGISMTLLGAAVFMAVPLSMLALAIVLAGIVWLSVAVYRLIH